MDSARRGTASRTPEPRGESMDQALDRPDMSFAAKARRAVLWRALKLLRAAGILPEPAHLLGYIGYLRHVQNLLETGERNNPDHLVGAFLTPLERLLARAEDVERARAYALYHYVLARTRHYDRILEHALAAGVRQIMFVGAGTDTRAFRFRDAIDRAGACVVETDLEPWISTRIAKSRPLPKPAAFHQRAFDLEADDLEAWTSGPHFRRDLPTLIVAEGVTPYITPAAHETLMRLARDFTPAGSRLAWDGKYVPAASGIDGGADAGRFRMPRDPDALRAIVEGAGLAFVAATPSAAAQRAFAPYPAPVFEEDVFLEARVR